MLFLFGCLCGIGLVSLHMEHLLPAGPLFLAELLPGRQCGFLLGSKSECHLFTMTSYVDIKTSHLFSSRFLCHARQTRGISLPSAILPLSPSFPLTCRQTDTHPAAPCSTLWMLLCVCSAPAPSHTRRSSRGQSQHDEHRPVCLLSPHFRSVPWPWASPSQFRPLG